VKKPVIPFALKPEEIQLVQGALAHYGQSLRAAEQKRKARLYTNLLTRIDELHDELFAHQHGVPFFPRKHGDN
jgi:hypothetical protein